MMNIDLKMEFPGKLAIEGESLGKTLPLLFKEIERLIERNELDNAIDKIILAIDRGCLKQDDKGFEKFNFLASYIVREFQNQGLYSETKRIADLFLELGLSLEWKERRRRHAARNNKSGAEVSLRL